MQGREVEAYLGVVFGDAVLGVNLFKDLLGGLRDIVGGRSGAYERELGAARDTAMTNLTQQALALGADAILGIDIDYEVLGSNNGMLMVTASGTAVRLKPLAADPGASPWARPAG
ncbi:MAG: heavy metal-binding domain-containing protein [Roseococcus sp.]